MRRCALVWVMVAGVAPASAQPIFSVDLQGFSNLSADRLYRPGTGNGQLRPIFVGGGVGMGLGRANDNINATSSDTDDDDFIWCMTVGGTAQGSAQPTGGGFAFNFNVMDQSTKNQVGADGFASTEAYNRTTGRIPSSSMGAFNTALMRNQGGSYPNVFGLGPFVGAQRNVDPNADRDIVNATMVRSSGAPNEVYYTLATGSESLNVLLGGSLSAADIVFDSNIRTPGGEALFASASSLGLSALDDIDAMTVFDNGTEQVFDAGDHVFFSLADGSPSLASLGGTAGDVFVVEAGATPTLFTSFSEFGIASTDDLTSLDAIGLIGGSAETTIRTLIPAPGSGVVAIGLSSALGLGRRRR